MSVKRYEVNGTSSVFEDANGSLVDYEDYAALEARCAALAEENAELKHAMAVTLEHVSVTDTGQAGVAAMIINDALHHSGTPATDAFLAEVRAHDLNAFIRHHSAELDAHIKNGGEQFDEKSVRIRDIIVSARLFREQIRKEADQ
ncbi:hypothetical protein [Escherichia coli]|uniref:hypothetical protein n=1 Tax=Escherichia coli TaxID=562 RepID=UPI002549F4D3|nr:hypothetical protein [Escherichia coli]